MDALGVIFLILFLTIITISIVLFQKRLKKIGTNYFIYKLIYALSCFVSVITILMFYFIFQNGVLIDLFKLKIDTDSSTNRITSMTIVMILNIIVNFHVLKSYSKRIYLRKITKEDEIELIGKE
ncbi:MAG: hypothetical protein V4572_10750 [Bacteroidota bacterium]